MPSCHDLLDQIITRSGLNRKDGNPLYCYRITTEELKLLQQELKFQFARRGTLRTLEECAAFCLFGAEWFRRHYQRGPWAWDVIFAPLDMVEPNKPSQQSVAECVKQGLRFWNLPLRSTQQMNLYLRTLVCQGGFPINTLRNDGAGLSRMLRECLRDHERYSSEPLSEILSRYIHFVPTTLQIEEVRRLAIDLVGAIARLRKISEPALSNGIARRDYLDQYNAGWEADLPLRVEEPEANLLLSLLDTATVEPYSTRELSLTTFILIDGNTGVIARRFYCPSVTFNEDDFRRVFRCVENTELFPRMTGYLTAGHHRVFALNITRSFDGSLRLAKDTVAELAGEQATQETALILAVGGEEIHRVELAGGEKLPESPWIFTSGDSPRLIGVGSARLRDESVIIALPADCELLPADASEIAEIDYRIADRKVIELSGEIVIRCEDVQYRIVTRSNASHDFFFELRGRRTRLGIGGSEVWVGPPTVRQIPLNEEERYSEVPGENVQWKPVEGGHWDTNFDACLGHVKIRVCSEGDTRYLERGIVLPHSFSLKVVPGSEPRTGELRITGLGKCRLEVESLTDVSINCERRDNERRIRVEVRRERRERPGLLGLRICFNNGNACELSIACPTSSYSILNALGKPVDFSNGIPIEMLDGLTLQVIQPNSRVPLIFWPDGPLLIDRMRESKDVPGIFEFPLSYIVNYATELLACSDDPDGKVKFGVGVDISRQPNYAWHVSRYSRALDRAKPLSTFDGSETTTEICVRDLAADAESISDEFKLTVVPLESPMDQMPADSITSTGRGKWTVNHADYSPGYYLALARDSNGSSFRPMRFVVKASEINNVTATSGEGSSRFSVVMNMYDKESRLHAWDEYISEIALDPSHSDWGRLDDLVDVSQTLPITTFEAVAAITRNHYASARYGILYPDREKMWRRFEQLPFLWSAIPIKIWLTMAARCWASTEKQLVDNGFSQDNASEILCQQRDLFVRESLNRAWYMSCVVLAMRASDRLNINFHPSILNHLTVRSIKLERSHLVTRRADSSTWPSFRVAHTNDEIKLLQAAQLLIDDGPKDQWVVLNSPGIAAVKAVYGSGISPEDVVKYKRIRAFDPDWYDTANTVTMFRLLDKVCKVEPSYFSNPLQ